MNEKQNISLKESKTLMFCLAATIILIPLNAYIWTAPLVVSFVLMLIKIKKSGTELEFGTLKNIGAIFFVISAISTINSKDIIFSITNWMLLPFMYAILYVSILNFSRNTDSRKKLIYALFSVAAIVLVYGFIQYANVQDMAHDLVTQSWVDAGKFPLLSRRMYSTLENPNLFGTYLIMIIGFVSSFFLQINEKKKKIILGIFLIALLSAAALTYSRTAWISLAIMVAGLGILYDKRILILLLAIPIVAFFYHGQIAIRLMSLLSQSDTSASLRIGLWQSTIAMIQDHPFLGIGWGSYFLTYPDYNFYIQDKTVIMYHAHNMYLSIIAETGIIGGITYILLIFLHGYTSFKLYKKAKDVINKSIGLGGVLVTIGILVSGIGDYTLFSRSVSGCLWAIFAIIMSAWIELKK